MHATDLTQRIDRLERDNRRLRAAFVATLALALVAATAPPGVVRATAFELVTDGGDVAGEWVAPGGYPALYLRDAEGVNRLALFHEADASGVYVSDAEGTTRIGIAQFAHGGGGVALHGPGSEGAAVLYYKDGGSLRFFDGSGTVTNEVRGRPTR